jgi:hypothetical protein
MDNYGLVLAVGVVLLIFLVIGYVVIQGTRVQLAWRDRVEAGDVDVIRTLVGDEVDRWKTARMPKGTDASVWHAVQSAELVDVKPDGVRLSAIAEGHYASVGGERREVSNALRDGMKVTARLIDMIMYDNPNVKLDKVQVDIYSTFRDEQGATQRCILSTATDRATANTIDWDEDAAEEIVRAFGGRYAMDDRGNATPISVDAPSPASVPAAFYEDE